MEKARKVKIDNCIKKEKEEEVIVEQVIELNDLGSHTFQGNPVIIVEDSEEDLEIINEPTSRCNLSDNDLKSISEREMLNDNIIKALQDLLRKKPPMINGLQDPLLGQNLAYEVMKEKPFIQVN